MFKNKYLNNLWNKLNLKKKEIELFSKIIKAYFKNKFVNSKSLTFKLENHIPISSARPRLGKFGNFYVPKGAINKKIIQNLVKLQLPANFKIINSPIRIQIHYYFPILKSSSRIIQLLCESKIIKPTKKPDIDNLEKAYLDAFTKFIWDDDICVIETINRKFYSSEPRVEITIKWIEGEIDVLSTYVRV